VKRALLLLGIVAALLGAAAASVWWRAQAPPANAPDRIARDPARPLVVCAGASVTHGRMGASYMALLEARLGARYQFANAGRNGDLAWNVLQRLDAVVALRPDVVVLQIGTNDVLASLDPDMAARYRRVKGLPVAPSLDFYRRSLAAIVDRLRAETRARVVILTLPLLGEDPDSAFNARVQAYNAVIRETAAAKGVPWLPLYETMEAVIRAAPPPRPAIPENRLVVLSLVQHFLLFRSFDEIGAGNGYVLLSDGVHLGSRGAAIVADVLERWLREAP